MAKRKRGGGGKAKARAEANEGDDESKKPDEATYQMKRLHGRTVRRMVDGEMKSGYMVEWKEFPDKEDRSWEPTSHIEEFAGDLLEAHREFIKLKAKRKGYTWDKYLLEDPNVPEDQRPGASDGNVCVVTAIRTASSLLGEPEYASEKRIDAIIALDGDFHSLGLNWLDAQKLVYKLNYLAMEDRTQEFSIGERASNHIKECYVGPVDVPLGDGIYIASAFNDAFRSVGHSFVIEVVKGVKWIHDTEVSEKPFQFPDPRVNWIRRWSYIHQVTKIPTSKSYQTRKKRKIKYSALLKAYQK